MFFSKSAFLFASILFIELFFQLWLTVTHRIPIGHEGLHYFLLQYFFLNNAVFSGQIPQWIPYMGHGTVALWFASQASIGQNLMFPIAPLLKNVPFNVIYGVGIFIDHLILIIGSWLLSGKYYRSVLTNFFVTLSLSGSVIWATQTWFNFHFYYFLPLIFYFFHRFYETWKWRYFLAVGNLMAFQSLANAAYFFPVISLTVFVYILSYIAFNKPGHDWEKLEQYRIKGMVSLFFVLAGFLLAAGLYAGHNEVIFYSYGRGSNGNALLDIFLHHGGNLTLNKWLELIVGLSPALDYTLYAGVLVPILFIFGFRDSLKRPYRHLICSTVFLLLVSLGSFVAVAVYYCWPFMKFYRHLALISPIIKMFIIFIAGVGFEKAVEVFKNQDRKEIFWFRFILLCALIFILYIWLMINHYGPYRVSHFMVNPGGLYVQNNIVHLIPGYPILLNSEPHIILRLIKSFIILVLIYLVFSRCRCNYRFLLALTLFLHIYDVYEYKYFETQRRTTVVSKADYGFLKFAQPVYELRRSEGLFVHNPRALFLNRLPACNGSRECIYNAYAFCDELGGTLLINFIHKNFDLYLRAINHQDFFNRQDLPRGLIPYRGLKFPMDSLPALKMSGFKEDKIQFFKNVSVFAHDRDIFNVIAGPEFSGNVPLIRSGNNQNIPSVSWEKNERMSVIYKILSYDANHLEFETDLTQSAWVYIAQVFSKHWQGFVNGRRIKIYPANLAYQAFPLQKGHNHILLKFWNPQIYWLYQFWMAMAYLWMIVLIRYLYLLIRCPGNAE